MFELTDKKSRSTRRALLRFLSHYDYGYRDAAIEISGIVRRNPSDREYTAPMMLVGLLDTGFISVMRHDRRAKRILDQIAAEYLGTYRSGTIGRSPLGCDMSLFATASAVRVPQLLSASHHSRKLAPPRSPPVFYLADIMISRTPQPSRRLWN